MPEPKRIDIAEFREFGYLHEINRQLLHPLGLALEVVTDDSECFSCGGQGSVEADLAEFGDTQECETCGGTGILSTEKLGGVWDSREDPEGFVYGDDLLSAEKAARVRDELQRRAGPRVKKLGYMIQPVGDS